MLTNRTRALQGGESGEPLMVAGQPEESELYRRLIHQDPDEQMPPKARLANEEISLLRDWIAGGAQWPVSNSEPAAAGSPIVQCPPGSDVPALLDRFHSSLTKGVRFH